MPLDLGRIDPSGQRVLLAPRDIFASLPAKPWPRLRLEQGEVLSQWFDRRTEQDLVCKQNTGGGKTVIGLLIGQSSLNEGVGPVVYLVPDHYLVQQVVREANRLGLPVTTDVDDPLFRASKATLVTTFSKLVNGRSVFGVTGDWRVPIQMGTVIVDDAHTALANARRQFTAEIPSGSPAYTRILALFAEELKRQNPKTFATLADGDHAAPMRIPFWAWSDRQDEVMAILREYGDDGELPSLFFPWPLVGEYLALAVATVTDRVLQIKPPCSPINLIPSFAHARRRVYLTATLADDGVLVTELDANPDSVRKPITPERAADLGDRMILAPLALNPQAIPDSVRRLARQIADGDRDGDGTPEAEPVNVIVLVPSDKAAREWMDYADHVLHVDDMKPVIDRLTASEQVGLVVLVNKYDGVDLPGDACRLLVVDGVPTPLDASERRESAALAGSATYETRQIQRLEQGMGRGIRDAEDHCAVLLLGNELALALVKPTSLALFSPATRAQIELSQQVAQQIEGEGLAAVRDTLATFLGRDPGWKALSSRATAGVEYDRDGHVSAVAVARRQAFDLATANDPAGAAATLQRALNAGVDPLTKGWFLEEVAAYQHVNSPVEAQTTIRAARTLNPVALMPAIALPPRELRGYALQGQAATEYLAATYDDPTTLRLWVGSILDDIAFDPNRTQQAEEAVRLLGLHLGFGSTRPDQEFGVGPDNHWLLSETTAAVIELKTGVTRTEPFISKEEVNQLSGSVNWDVKTNKHVTHRIPVLIHPHAQLHAAASPPAGMRIITPSDLTSLKQAVVGFVNDLTTDEQWTQAPAVASALSRYKLSSDKLVQTYSRAPSVPPKKK